MVYINTFNAIFTVVLITLLSGFIILTAYLWNENLKMRAEDKIEEAVSGMNKKDCLSLISHYEGRVVLYNECRFNPDINLYINDEFVNYSKTYEDSTIILEFDDRNINSLRIVYDNGRITK